MISVVPIDIVATYYSTLSNVQCVCVCVCVCVYVYNVRQNKTRAYSVVKNSK